MKPSSTIYHSIPTHLLHTWRQLAVSSNYKHLARSLATPSGYRRQVMPILHSQYRHPTSLFLLSSKRCIATTRPALHYTGMGYPGGPDSGRDYSGGMVMNGADDTTELVSLTDPRTIVKHLDDYIIGQARAKKILAVAIYNHYNRVRANLFRQEQQEKENTPLSVHMLGNASTGKITTSNTGAISTPGTNSPATSTTAPSTMGNSTPSLIHPASSQSNLSYSTNPPTTPSSSDSMLHSTQQIEHHHSTLQHDDYTGPSHPSIISNGLDSSERLLSFGTQRRASWLNPPTEGGANTSSSSSTHHKTGFDTSTTRQDDMVVHDKSNVLLIGPTGSGKTLLARTLAQILEVPFSSSDATPFTQAGYVGEDVELVIHRLLQACDYDVKRAETGIVFIDEIDKISRRSDSSSGSRDVSGEGVQQSLLRMLEGTVVNIVDKSGNAPSHRRGGVTGNVPMGGGGSGGPSTGAKGESYSVDTSNILFILSGAFIGLDKTVKDRIAKGSIGFDAVIQSANDDVIMQDGKSTLQPLDMVEPSDLVQYGLIPEFVGRLPVLANVNSLSKEDLVRVLTEPKNSLLKQYEALFKLSQIDLRFSQAALHNIAELALEKKTGARGLRRIMENVLLDPMFDTPGSNIKQVVIDSDVVNKKKSALYLRNNQTSLGDKMIAADDGLPDFVSSIPSVRQQMSQQ
ncbi:P-loop containing nucleoside triphosphate hydrolase protein [Chlamydoabsidia padenii]|nr:P-loop containing nucleoside triphosphate hydrolase protein [Chlamydoabsidia padenii]